MPDTALPSAKVTAARLERREDVQAAIEAARTARTVTTRHEYGDAEGYLTAVVLGTEVADPIRVSAARALIQYQRPRTRRPVPALHTPTEQIANDAAADERARRDEWAARAAAIRRKVRHGAD